MNKTDSNPENKPCWKRKEFWLAVSVLVGMVVFCNAVGA